MSEYPNELESDLLEFWQIDILDYWRGKLSLRRVAVLLKRLMHMAGRSALASKLDVQAEWSTLEYMTAEMIDRLELANWLAIRINSEKSDVPQPEPIPRPGHKEVTPVRDFATPAEVAALFSGM